MMNSRKPSPIPADPTIPQGGPVIRTGRPTDAAALPATERSAAQRFASIPALAWLATGDVMPAEAHLPCIAAGTCWVAEDTDGAIAGFLSAGIRHDCLHILEFSVRQDMQGQGMGRALLHAAMLRVQQMHMPGGLTLTTFHDVAWNAPFYRAMGFEELTSPAPWLAELLAQEEAQGLTPGSRCAMRWRAAEKG
ncbi:GNAT family N-acetyltransferase [Novacetimonas hansenii]|uniref:GNAT family N-acetyltransferase n=1 Tax=Novacetimonas hansenii TaxID=436 RepID=UPI0039EAD86E